jgi:hypothetical protein
MNMMQLSRMLYSPHECWDEIERSRPGMDEMFRKLVLPLSLLPPAMILYASSAIGAELLPGTQFGNWLLAAVFFFVAQHFSVPLMAGAIREAAIAKGVNPSLREAYAVAAIAPVPLWLSSLALLFGSPWFVITVAVAGLIAAGVLVHHGVERLLGVEEAVDATEMAVQVISLGVLAWVVLLLVALVPLLVF